MSESQVVNTINLTTSLQDTATAMMFGYENELKANRDALIKEREKLVSEFLDLFIPACAPILDELEAINEAKNATIQALGECLLGTTSNMKFACSVGLDESSERYYKTNSLAGYSLVNQTLLDSKLNNYKGESIRDRNLIGLLGAFYNALDAEAVVIGLSVNIGVAETSQIEDLISFLYWGDYRNNSDLDRETTYVLDSYITSEQSGLSLSIEPLLPLKPHVLQIAALTLQIRDFNARLEPKELEDKKKELVSRLTMQQLAQNPELANQMRQLYSGMKQGTDVLDFLNQGADQ